MVGHGKKALGRRGAGHPRLTLTLCPPGGGEGNRGRGFRSICARCVVGFALFLVADAVLFGGVYFRWVAPESSAGTIGVAIDNFSHIPRHRTAILAIGDSRVSEGFSAAVAQHAAASQSSPYTFFNAAVPGTTPRVWYYLLRQLDDPGQRLAAVVLMLTSYHDDGQELLADRDSDIAYLHPLLGSADLADFPWTFASAANRVRALEAILLKGMFYSADLRDFLADPMRRVYNVTGWRRHGYDWIHAYPGRAASLAGLAFDPGSGRLTLPPGRGEEQTSLLPAYAERFQRLRKAAPENAAAAAYRRLWIGRIAALCRQAQVRLFVYRIPRGPLDYLAPPDDTPSGALARLEQAGMVEVLPAATFTALERPAFFFDRLHLNRTGRQRFSTMLAQSVLQRLPTAP